MEDIIQIGTSAKTKVHLLRKTTVNFCYRFKSCDELYGCFTVKAKVNFKDSHFNVPSEIPARNRLITPHFVKCNRHRFNLVHWIIVFCCCAFCICHFAFWLVRVHWLLTGHYCTVYELPKCIKWRRWDLWRKVNDALVDNKANVLVFGVDNCIKFPEERRCRWLTVLPQHCY